jgi:hypothetical protein
MAENFSQFFDRFLGKKTIQTFDDKKVKKSLVQIFHFDGTIPSDLATELKYMNDCGAGVYICVNETDGKGRRADNIVKVRAAYADLDGAPLSVAMGFDPTLVVESSKGRFHCYWFTEDTPVEAFTVLQKNVIRMLKSDPHVHDLPRVLRVPGFYHNKYDPFLTRVHGGSDRIFKYRELVERFPPETVKQFSAKRYHLDKKTSFSSTFRGTYGAGNGERNDHVIRRIGGMLKRGCDWPYIESEAFKEGYACVPPLEDSEIRAILKSAERWR